MRERQEGNPEKRKDDSDVYLSTGTSSGGRWESSLLQPGGELPEKSGVPNAATGGLVGGR